MRYLNAVVTLGATFAMACGGAADSADSVPDAVSADPQHYTVAFENDAVRLLRITYGPGETSVLHEHPGTCSIALTPATWEMTDAAGETTTSDPSAPGDLSCSEDADVHNPRNPTDDTNELILVELKEGATVGTAYSSETPDAATADPDHYSVAYENDAIRVLEVAYGPGEASEVHSHPALCFVTITPTTMRDTEPGSPVEDTTNEAGAVECVEAEEHRPMNSGDIEMKVVLIEFKGRAVAGE